MVISIPSRSEVRSAEVSHAYSNNELDINHPDSVHLKVGRTVNLVKRIDQWSKQCESKEQVLRGFWPGNGSTDPSNLMKGRVKPGSPGKYCYRLERLIHLELADLVQNKPYLLPGFPNIDTPPDRNTSTVEKRKCPDCEYTALHRRYLFGNDIFCRWKNTQRDLHV